MGVSPMALGDTAVGHATEGVGVESWLAVLWNEAASERESPLGFERFKLSTGGKGVDEKRGDDDGSLRGESWTPCIDWRSPGVNVDSSGDVAMDNRWLPPSGEDEVDACVMVTVMGMSSLRRPRPRSLALDRCGAVGEGASSGADAVSGLETAPTAGASTSIGVACEVRKRLMGEGPLTMRRGGSCGVLGLDLARLPSTEDGEQGLVAGERMGRVASEARGERGVDGRKRALKCGERGESVAMGEMGDCTQSIRSVWLEYVCARVECATRDAAGGGVMAPRLG